MEIWATIGAALTAAIGIWRFFSSKNRKKRQAADKADQMLKEGIKEGDTSKITAAWDRIRRIK